MTARIDTEGSLAREHAAREARRASAFILNLVLLAVSLSLVIWLALRGWRALRSRG